MEAEDYVTDNLDDMSDMSHQHITQILQDRKGFLWLSSWNGLYRFDGYGFVAFKATPGDGNNMGSCRFRNIVLDYDVTPLSAVGNIYCLVDDDVFLFDVRMARFVSVGGSQERTARRLFKDNGSRTGGFTDDRGIRWKITPDGFFRSVPRERKWRRVDAVPGTVTRLMYRDRLGRVWIGTKDGRLTVLDSNLRLLGYMGKDGRLHDSDTEFYPVYSICEDSEGAMWLGSKPFGLFRLRGDSLEHIGGLNSGSVYDLKTDRRGRLWVATHVGGISVISRKDGRYVIEPVAATKGLRIRRLLILDDGTLIATTTTGLLVADNIYRPSDRVRWRMHVREPNRAESLSDNATMDVVKDCRGRVFVTTESGGLNLLLTENLHADRFSFRHYGLENGLGSDVTMASAGLNDSVLLVQCNNMLSLLNTKTLRMENFGKSFWGENLQFSDAEPLLLPGGRLLISLQTGVLAVAASDLYAVDYKPRIVLTGLRAAGISSDYVVDYTVDYRDTIVINPSQRDFTLSFSALDFTGNRYIRYATKLDEDSLWSHPTATNSIDFRDIAAGTHTLSIRSTNALGQWTDNVRTVTIVVEPTFFETWYGRMFLMIAIAGLIVLLTYTVIYVRALEKRRKETLEAYLLLLDQKKEASGNAPTESEQHAKQHAEQRPEPIVIAPRLSAEDEAFMKKIADFTERNISNSDININDMAAASAVSRSGLNRKMRQLLGVTPADFLKEARMKRAVKMLKETDTPVADIAYACGFSDPKYFAKCVKASTGMTPRELRDSNP